MLETSTKVRHKRGEAKKSVIRVNLGSRDSRNGREGIDVVVASEPNKKGWFVAKEHPIRPGN